MKTYFDTTINYKGENLKVKIQCLSNELPKIIYAVSLNPKDLKVHFENVKHFYFHSHSELNEKKILETTNYVVYDYKTEEYKIKDVEFEFGVWNTLSTLNL